MNPKKSIFAILVILFGAALFTIVYEFKTARSIQGQLSALNLERSNIASEVQRLRRELAENKQTESLLRQELKATQSAETAVNENALSNTVRRGIVAWADLRYGRLFRMLGLTPEQIAKFEDLTVNHQLALHDITEAAKNNGILATDPSVLQIVTQEMDQFHAQEAELLGEAGYQQLQEDNRTSQPRSWANGLAGNLYFSEPLSAQQEDSLVQIMANQDPGYKSGSSANTWGIQDWDTVFTQAQSVLSPAQFNAMKSMQATYPAGMNAVKEALALQPQ